LIAAKNRGKSYRAQVIETLLVTGMIMAFMGAMAWWFA
jgi:hypothetical protein